MGAQRGVARRRRVNEADSDRDAMVANGEEEANTQWQQENRRSRMKSPTSAPGPAARLRAFLEVRRQVEKWQWQRLSPEYRSCHPDFWIMTMQKFLPRLSGYQTPDFSLAHLLAAKHSSDCQSQFNQGRTYGAAGASALLLLLGTSRARFFAAWIECRAKTCFNPCPSRYSGYSSVVRRFPPPRVHMIQQNQRQGIQNSRLKLCMLPRLKRREDFKCPKPRSQRPWGIY